MNVVKSLISLIVLSFFLVGCLQIDTSVYVNKDGSGVINEKVLISKTFVNMIKEFAQSFQDSSNTEEFSLFSDEEIIRDAKSYGESVKYVTHEFVSDDNWEGYTAVYSFDDVTKIKLSPDPDSKVNVATEATEEPVQQDYYFFKFVKGDEPELIIDHPEIDISTAGEDSNQTQESAENNEESGDDFLTMMEDIRINISVEVEGNIVSTNAQYVEGSKITLLQMDFSEMIKNKEDFKKFRNKEPKNIEEMKEFLDKLPGMKLEIQKPVTVKFN